MGGPWRARSRPAAAGGRETFIDRVKALIDRMHAYHAMDPATFPVDDWTRDIASMHIADSIVVIEKRRREKPVARKVGKH